MITMSLHTALLALQIVAATPPAPEPVAATCAAPADLRATPFAEWALPDGNHAAIPEIGRPTVLALENGGTSRQIAITEAGRYGIAADGKVWIDVITNAAPVSSIGHGHGPACSGIRKIVWFDLSAGTYEMALSKAEVARVRLLIVRAP
jgi:hypothetical protein